MRNKSKTFQLGTFNQAIKWNRVGKYLTSMGNLYLSNFSFKS